MEGPRAENEENLLDDLLLHHEPDEMPFAEEEEKKTEEQIGSDISEDEDDMGQGDEDGDRDVGGDKEEERSDISEDEQDQDEEEESQGKKGSRSDTSDSSSSDEDDEEDKEKEDKVEEVKEDRSAKEARDFVKTSPVEKNGSAAAVTEVKKKGKSYDYATKLNYLFRDARFFLVKSNNGDNVALAKAKGVWSTPPANETRFNQAFQEARQVEIKIIDIGLKNIRPNVSWNV